MLTSGGSAVLSSASAASIFSERSSVLVSGCFVTVIITHGLPRSDATPVFGVRLPIFTAAMSPSVTAAPPAVFTKAAESAAVSRVASMPRMMYSLPYSYSTPPEAFVFMPSTAATASLSPTP